ncbi:hypothetical protein D3C85_1629690 [compost metagenome]
MRRIGHVKLDLIRRFFGQDRRLLIAAEEGAAADIDRSGRIRPEVGSYGVKARFFDRLGAC